MTTCKRCLVEFQNILGNWRKIVWDGLGHNGTARINRGFGRIHLILPQNKAKICPIIVTVPIVYGNPLNSDSINIYIPELEAKGVYVEY